MGTSIYSPVLNALVSEQFAAHVIICEPAELAVVRSMICTFFCASFPHTTETVKIEITEDLMEIEVYSKMPGDDYSSLLVIDTDSLRYLVGRRFSGHIVYPPALEKDEVRWRVVAPLLKKKEKI